MEPCEETWQGARHGDHKTLSLERDFNFDGLVGQTAEGLNDSDSDGGVNSDIEDAIMAQLYFSDVKSKASGKRVSVAKQLGSSEVRLDQSSDGSSFSTISFVMENQRTRRKRRHSPVDRTESQSPPNRVTHGLAAGVVEGPPGGNLGGEKDEWDDGKGGEQGGGVEEESRCATVRKKYRLNRATPDATAEGSSKLSKQKHRWGRKSPKGTTSSSPAGPLGCTLTPTAADRAADDSRVAEGKSRGRGDSSVTEVEEYVGVREMEEWEDSSNTSGESHHSSDMDLSDDQVTEGQLFLEVAAEDKWHIILKDVMGSEEYERQYGRRSLGKKFGKCFNCKQKGQHQSNTCPHPIRHQVCYICAGYDHISSRCPSDYCTYCFLKKHKGKPCSAPWGRYTVCQRCYCNGHDESTCHEQWRQYHNTTLLKSDNDGLVSIAPSQQRQMNRVFCFNCGRKGHFGHECPKERPRGFAVPLTPHIAAYDDPNSTTKSRRKHRNRHRYRDTNDLEWGTNSPIPMLNNRRRGKGDGLLEMPTSPAALLNDHHPGWFSNGRQRGQDADSSHEHHQTRRIVEHHRSHSFDVGASPAHNMPSPQIQWTPPPMIHQPTPPPRPLFHTPPAGSSYSDGNRQIMAVQPPQRTMSEPQRHQFAPTRRFSHDPTSHVRHNLREGPDFPRTPLPTKHPRPYPDPQSLLPPPMKPSRRESEPFYRRLNHTHDRLNDKPMQQQHYSTHAARNSAAPSPDYRRRSSWHERGFRGSDRAVSLVQSHGNKDGFHHRTPRYGNR